MLTPRLALGHPLDDHNPTQVGAAGTKKAPAMDPKDPWHCPLCNIRCPSAAPFSLHMAGAKHRNRKLWAAVGGNTALHQDQGGVVVSGHPSRKHPHHMASLFHLQHRCVEQQHTHRGVQDIVQRRTCKHIPHILNSDWTNLTAPALKKKCRGWTLSIRI